MAELRPSIQLAIAEADREYPRDPARYWRISHEDAGAVLVYDARTTKRVATVYGSSDEERE